MEKYKLNRRLVGAVGVGLLAGCTPTLPQTATAPEAPAAVRQAIGALLSTQTATWNRGDVAGFMQGYWPSDSLVFIGKNGPTYGYQATLANYRKSYPSPAAMGQLDFSNLQVTPLAPGAAQVVGRWHLARPAAGDLQGHFLLVLRKLSGQWLIVADHSS
ncbi:YybH family protein [uncultured Hymenobacter sp.]|uniref:YybH family protein n=1 Tax=uncultured Hymenobacter sp. TaxID=170016 RepID=UPI0035C9DC7D